MWPTHLIPFNLINQNIFGEGYRSFSSSRLSQIS
jgi:hypothetical protein